MEMMYGLEILKSNGCKAITNISKQFIEGLVLIKTKPFLLVPKYLAGRGRCRKACFLFIAIMGFRKYH
jgi:hypothetical protein